MGFHEVSSGLDELQYQAKEYSKRHGFWDDDTHTHQTDSEKIALMHSELSEALSALRDGDMAQVELELADVVLRVADYCAHRGLRLSNGVNRVQEKNRNREHKHGRQW